MHSLANLGISFDHTNELRHDEIQRFSLQVEPTSYTRSQSTDEAVVWVASDVCSNVN